MTVTGNLHYQRAKRFLAQLRHCQVLGMRVEEASEKSLTLAMEYREEHIGTPSTGVIHGGVITTLMDTALGTMVINALPEFELCPTLDLRVDYVRVAEPGQPIYAYAEAYHVTRTVVFTRGIVHQGDRNWPVANCVATFMRIGSHLTPPAFRKTVLSEGP